MKPILYEQTETSFTSQGIGVLADALKCTITEELNNFYDLEMTYPVTGAYFRQLTLRRIIKAKPNQTDDPQPFRIYKITKPMNGSITVLAHHLSYDLSGVVVPPFTVNTAGGVIASLTATSVPTIQPFFFTNSVLTSANYKNEKPQSARAVLGDFLNVFGGEISYDKTEVIIETRRGADKGAVIAYGKNLMDLRQEESCAEVYTGVFPYYHSDDVTVTLTEKVINLPGTFPFTKIMPLDLTPSFTEVAPTQAQLRTAANQYIADNNIGVPKVNLTISYVSIEESDEAIPMHMYEGIALGDTVGIRFARLGINTSSRCIQYVYDAVKEHVESITIGDKITTFVDTTAKQYQAMESGEYDSIIHDAISRATQLITNGLGGYVVIHKSDPALTHPDEILILGDSPDINEATQVWRWNKNGLAYSDDGYQPTSPHTYKTAMTADGQIVADMITTGILQAIEISNGNGTFHVTPQGYLTAQSGTIGGFNIGATSIYNDSISLDSNGLSVVNNGTPIGRFVRFTNDSVGILMSGSGKTISWNWQRSDGTYDTILAYDKDADRIEINKDVYLVNHTIFGLGGLATDSLDGLQSTSITYERISIDTGNPGYMTISTHRAYFNAYGQYTGSTDLGETTYELEEIHAYHTASS